MKETTVNQPTAAPTNKVVAAGIAGALTIVAVYLADQIGGVIVPPEVAAAVTTIFSFVAGYFTKNSAESL